MISKSLFLLLLGGLIYYASLESGIDKAINNISRIGSFLTRDRATKPVFTVVKKLSGTALKLSGIYFLLENIHAGHHEWDTLLYAALCTYGTKLATSTDSPMDLVKRFSIVVGATSIATQALAEKSLFSEYVQTVFASGFFTKSVIEFLHAAYNQDRDKALLWLGMTGIACSLFSQKNILTLLNKEDGICLKPPLTVLEYFHNYPSKTDYLFSYKQLKFFKKAQDHATPFALRAANHLIGLSKTPRTRTLMSQNYFLAHVLPYLYMNSNSYMHLRPLPSQYSHRTHADVTTFATIDRKGKKANISFEFVYPFISEYNFQNYLRAHSQYM